MSTGCKNPLVEECEIGKVVSATGRAGAIEGVTFPVVVDLSCATFLTTAGLARGVAIVVSAGV